jgi:acetylornithine deacetylase/succinyl-diaminopimelate desuccinylase-like protein
MKLFAFSIAAAVLAAPAAAQQPLRPDQQAFRALYKELVETNTAFSNGSCTLAAERLAARMWAAGFAKADAQVITAPDHPREGNLVAVLPGTSKTLKPILLLAHIDVVEAKREDWTRDPFSLIEEDGYFFGRGVSDDKAQAAIWVDSLIRFKQSGYRPKRTIKLAATCGEESSATALNGAEWLARNKPETLSAAFALNEGGGGRVDKAGKRQLLAIQVGEKANRSFILETTNPGGHSSIPRPDNAIYDLAAAITKVQGLSFPVKLNDTTRAFLKQFAGSATPPVKQAIAALLANEGDVDAATLLSRDPVMNSTLRTSCVATMLDAGRPMPCPNGPKPPSTAGSCRA